MNGRNNFAKGGQVSSGHAPDQHPGTRSRPAHRLARFITTFECCRVKRSSRNINQRRFHFGKTLEWKVEMQAGTAGRLKARTDVMGPESAWSNHRVEPSLASLKELRDSGFKCTPPGGENGRLGKTGAAEGHDAISITVHSSAP